MLRILLLSVLCVFAFGKPIISVSIPPQAFFVEKIAKDSVEINILIPPNSDEHTMEFKPQALKKLEQSEIYFLADLELEKILEKKFKSVLKNVKIVNINEGIHLLEGGHDHEHEHDHDHDRHHAEEHDEHNDPHVWLDPILVKKLAQNITQALVQSFPNNKEFYEANLANFLKELDQMDAQIAEKLKNIKRNEFIVYHPSWAYLAKRYNLVQIPVEIDGKEPKSKDLQNLIKLAKEKDIRVIFVQSGFPENSAKVLAKELNAQIVSINHLARNWDEELLKSIQALSSALQ
ncbi:zinc ABC transporter substrate-binding protein [Campylobacter coli]|uniref:metal ABC transporter solute-binding protein, Zn/Mn family n=1 Tax=Campylobacter coli TaxID=195 RepID=UPI00069B9240|nr:zinc ABC transporter substrate-binding protein [Campylobacter coli]EAI9236658.1 cation ABC transporter substrate-binding protein [Campylobacter coli]EAJ3585635.1 cation ABC transporter substrate-binding protein [Campylobacter coli]EAK7927352.1 cation ABC transporter substrate-binding protein [Campylobacter coli]EAK8564936.1 cation ABC transporter substrate-binding protein [Campylobacter coli]EAL0387590.1 cation ABC transporter substrate-binding protein [Campylobacter coli]